MALEAGRITARIEAETADFDLKLARAERAFDNTASKMQASANQASGSVRKFTAEQRRHMEEAVRLEEAAAAASQKANSSAIQVAREQARVQREGMAMARAHAAALREDARRNAAIAGTATTNIGRLRGQFTTLAASLIPLPANVTRLGSALSGLALSGGITIGVLAGAAAIGFVWNQLTAGAKRIKDAAADAAKEVDRLGKTDVSRLAEHVKAFNSEIERLEKKQVILSAIANVLGGAGAVGAGLFGRAAAQAGEAQTQAQDRANKAEAERIRLLNKENLERAAKLNGMQAEIDKHNALYTARASDSEALQLLALRMDALAAKRSNALLLTGTELKLANALVDARLREASAVLELELAHRKLIQSRIDAAEGLERRRPAVVGPSVQGTPLPGAVGIPERITLKKAGDAYIENAERIKKAQEELEQRAERLANAVTDSFARIVTGTESVGQAFKRMVTSIIADLARLALQKSLTDLFARLLGSLPAVAGGGAGPNTPVTVTPPAGTQSSVIVQQSVNLVLNAIDGRSAATFIRENSGNIAQVVGESAMQSAAYARMLRGR